MSGYIYLGLLFIVASAGSDRNFQFIMDAVSVQTLASELIEDFGVSVIQLHNRSYVNGHLKLRHDLNQFDLKWVLDLRKSNNQTVRLVDIRMDACKYLEGKQKGKIFNIFLKIFRKHVLGDLACPLESNRIYTLENWYIDAKDFPGYVPECNFQGFTEFFIQKRKLAIVNFSGQISRI